MTANRDVETRTGPGWADVRLIHDPLPVVDLDEVDLSVELLGKPLRAPLVIAGMTGGHAMAHEINATLARAAERHGLAMGIGSQRAALRKPELAYTYAIVRNTAPSAFLIGNIGAAQLVEQTSGPALTTRDVRAAVTMIKADALAVHLNFLEESVQIEGDRRAKGCAEAVRAVVETVGVPVIAKETGAGMSRAAARHLRDLGVSALDVGGLGGTTFAAVEAERADIHGNEPQRRLGETLRDWGIPTAVSIVGAAEAGLPVIATGGVRSGLDAAKALALGADLVGVARPFLQAALQGDTAVDRLVEQLLRELRTVVFLSGCRTPADLRSRPRVILGETRAWLEQLGYLPR